MSRRAIGMYLVFLLIPLWLLRAQLAIEVGVPLEHALALGLPCGVLLDLAMALLVAGAAVCAGAWDRRIAHAAGIVLSLVVAGFSAANVAYFGYFDARLEPWVIRTHLRDLPAISGSVASVFAVPALFACVIGVPLVLLALRSVVRRSIAPVASAGVGAALVTAAIAVAAGATLVKHRLVDGSSILAEQVFVVWLEDARGLLPHEAARRRGIEQMLREATALDPSAPGRVLATLRDWAPGIEPLPGPKEIAAARPLVRDLRPDVAHTLALRSRLGLPPDGPIHIVILFLESVRAFEMEHPALGPQVFPRTHAVLSRHALRFPTAYASTPDVGKTVQGQFATLCSLLPNFGGAAAYTSHPYLRVTSLAEVARDQGYHTLWISGGEESFHNKRVFESLHGTDRFFGFEYLRGIPFEGTHPECGYPDGPMLREAVRILEREAHDGRPVFANILTLSTHHPVTEVEEGPVPATLRAAAREWPAQKDYAGYLSRLRYLDESLEPFFTALFAGPLGDRALVVMLGDHGQRYRPHVRLAQHQLVELMARVPLAIVTKHARHPGTVEYPVHQIDVAPTVADIAGFSGRVAWLGRNVLDGPGSPWIIAEQERLHYRVGTRACYTLQGDAAPSCYQVDAGVDPMLSFVLPRVPTDSADVRFFRSTAVAARQAITLNLVMPGSRDR